MTLLERCAVKLYHAKARNKPYALLTEEFKNQYRKQARAVLSEVHVSLSRPTPAMKQAAADFIGNYDIAHEAIRLAIAASPLAKERDMDPAELSKIMEERHMKILTGKFKHYCWEWDGMAIDETCAEFEVCSCFDALHPTKPESKVKSDG